MEWAGGLAGICQRAECVAAVVSVLMTVGAAMFRDLPREEYRGEALVSQWLRVRWYTASAVVLIAVYPVLVDPHDIRLYACIITFVLATFVATPLVERKNVLRNDREPTY